MNLYIVISQQLINYSLATCNNGPRNLKGSFRLTKCQFKTKKGSKVAVKTISKIQRYKTLKALYHIYIAQDNF